MGPSERCIAVATVNAKKEDRNGVLVELNADYSDPANKSWAAFTPSLTINMYVVKEVANTFNVGETLTVTFEKKGE